MWRFAKEKDLAALTRFLRRYEHACVSFTAQLQRDGALTLPPRLRERVVIYEGAQGDIEGAILHASTGFVYPVFSADTREFPEPGARLLMPLRHPPLLFGAVMGARRDVELFEGVISARARDDMIYHLMWRPAECPPLPAHPALQRVRAADAGDFAALLPLQAAYEEEEVLLPGRRLNMRVVEHNLRQSLKKQIVLIGENEDGPVTKVATNARGLGFDQVGGVYTLPEYRNRGLAGHLMRHLICRVGRAGRSTTLFVKKHNTPAVAMYRHLQYREAGDFRIIYYR